MKIEKLDIQGYQGINFLNLDIDQPIVMVAGRNATGKTSIRDAIQFALTGVSSRVSMKKEYGHLVRIGSDPKQAQVSLTVDGFTFTRKVATGKAGHEEADYPLVLPHLLGSSRFALLPHADKAKLLFAVTGVKRDRDTIAAMMIERGIKAECVEQAKPMLRSGFSAAVKSCKAEQSKSRGAWEAVTEERFGEAKAVNWQAVILNATPVKELEQVRDDLRKAIPKMEKEIEGLESQKDAMRQHTHSGGVKYQCPCCEADLIVMQGKLVVDERGEEPEPSFETQNALIGEINGLRTDLATMQRQLGGCESEIIAAKDAERLTEERTRKATEYFENYKAWKAAADALSATGIPLQLLEAGLKPVNDRLADTSAAAGWKKITIHADLSISYGDIGYSLCSESEQWRVDAAITEAFAKLSNVKLFVLDRMDVLHPADRSGLIGWLLTASADHDSIFVMATLKQAPKGLPDAIQTFWLEEGGALEKAA